MAVQIFRYVTKDKILDFEDWMSLEPKKNKLRVTLLEYGPDNKATHILHHYLDPDSWKVVCWGVLMGRFEKWTDYKGTPSREGKPEARVLSLTKDDRYRNPYILRLARGKGEVMGAGAVRMVGQPTKSLTLLLPDFEAKRLALACLDYIRAWDVIHLRERVRRDEAERAARRGGI